MKTRGFTLSECLVLVVVLALIGAILVPMFGDIRKRMMGKNRTHQSEHNNQDQAFAQ